MTTIEQVTEEIKELMGKWNVDVVKYVINGNERAGQRCRKTSVELGKLMKRWRALSTGREEVTE